MRKEIIIELDDPPLFELGQKVRALRDVRNDGTFPGYAVGDRLIQQGDVGYVNSIGSFVQQFYIYGVDFIERGRVVGMRAKELERVKD